MTPTTLKNMWVCTRKVFGEENYDYSTISVFELVSTHVFIKNNNMSWEAAQNIGWRCIKVDITFNPK